MQADEPFLSRILHKYSIKNVTGLNILPLAIYRDPFDIITHLLVGSEGTLAFLSEFTMKTGKDYPFKASAMLYFNDIKEACRAVVAMKKGPAMGAELLDKKSLESVDDPTGRGLTAVLTETMANTKEELYGQIEQIEGILSAFKTAVPVKFTDTWNKMKTNHLFFSGKYNIGYNDQKKDSLGNGEFIPVASVIFTSHYTGQDRRFLSYDTVQVTVEGKEMQRIDQFYPNRFYNTAVDDSTTFSSLKNTFALSLREGFKPWVKFGLTGYIEHELRNFSMMDSINGTIDRRKHRENSLFIGGILNKQQGENLKFNLQANLGVVGVDLGEFNLEGEVETAFAIAGKRTTLSGHAYIKNLTPNYLQKHYHSKYFWWNKDFGNMRRVFVGGKLYIPFTNTTLSVGVENLQNYIYFDKDRNSAQYSSNVQVLTVGVEQNLRLGVFNWDNRVVYQTSGNQEVIPVPTVSIYSNMYLKALIVNELTFQFGVDAHYHTAYFSPGYEPALLQFYNQREKEIGNYPIATVYANMHLKQTRFFVMLYNAASAVWKPRDYFSLPGYPVNPMMLKLGLSVDLHN